MEHRAELASLEDAGLSVLALARRRAELRRRLRIRRRVRVAEASVRDGLAAGLRDPDELVDDAAADLTTGAIARVRAVDARLVAGALGVAAEEAALLQSESVTQHVFDRRSQVSPASGPHGDGHVGGRAEGGRQGRPRPVAGVVGHDPSSEPPDGTVSRATRPEDDPASGRSPKGFVMPPLDEDRPATARRLLRSRPSRGAPSRRQYSPASAWAGRRRHHPPPQPETSPGDAAARVPRRAMSTRRPFEPLEPFGRPAPIRKSLQTIAHPSTGARAFGDRGGHRAAMKRRRRFVASRQLFGAQAATRLRTDVRSTTHSACGTVRRITSPRKGR